MRGLFFLILLFSSFLLSAQTSIVEGIISDAASKDVLPGVTVLLNDSTGTSSDTNGKYSIKVSAGRQKITFRFVGFVTKIISLNVKPDEITILNVLLEPFAEDLGTVVVSASRYEQKIEEVTVSMEVLKPSYIENTNTTTLETTLDQVPGVTVMDGSVGIRGGSGFTYGAGSRVLLMVDDLPMLAADAGDVKWTFLPVENIGQVEIIKGASSALFGSSALNGIINIRTAYPKSEPQGSVIIYHGIYDDPRRKELRWWRNANPAVSGSSFSYTRKLGQIDLVTGGNAFSDEGYRLGEKEQRIRLNTNFRYRFKNISGLSAGFAFNETYAQGGNFLIWQDDSSGAYLPFGGLDTPATTLSNYVTTRISMDPYITYLGKNGSTHKLRTRFFRSNNENDSKQQAIADYYHAEYSFGKKFGRGINLTSGVGTSASIVKSELYGDHRGTNLFGYTQLEKSLFKKLILSAGVRGEYFKVDSFETKTDVLLWPGTLRDSILIARNSRVKPVVRFGANYHVLKATFLRSSFGEGYRFPTIAEKYIKTNAGSIYIFPNDSVRPETGWSAEIGIKQGIKISRFLAWLDIAYFFTEYNDMMEFNFGRWDTTPGAPLGGLGFKTRNMNDALISGVDISLEGEGKIGKINFAVMAGYTYMEPYQKIFTPAEDTLTGTTSYNILKYRSRNLVKADAEAGFRKFTMGISFRYNSRIDNIDKAFEFFFPSIQHYRKLHKEGDYVFDGRLSFQLKESVKISFISKNILNREYMGRPADMQAPRSFVLQVGVKF